MIGINCFFLVFLYFANYDDVEMPGKNDPLKKVHPFMILAKEIAKNSYLPLENLVIDESVMIWRGRLIFRQYIPSKGIDMG